MIKVTIEYIDDAGGEHTLMRKYSDDIQYDNWCKNTWEQLEIVKDYEEPVFKVKKL